VRSTFATEGRQRAEYFPSTHWSLIFEARLRGEENQPGDALGKLCQMYWRPIWGFICRQGYPPSEAQDLVQDFFLAVFQGKLVDSATPVRGRFRSLLLKSLKNFLIDAKISAGRRKRGGGFAFVSLEHLNADIPISCSPEAFFDIQWALTIAEEAVRRLREESESKGQRWLYEALVPYLDVDRTEICYRTISAQLRIPEKAVKQLLYQFRKRLRGLLKEEVAKTVKNSADVEDEIRYLCEALASAPV
jgi:DNA-directed RNA polymerase specialized sigma24 family protein